MSRFIAVIGLIVMLFAGATAGCVEDYGAGQRAAPPEATAVASATGDSSSAGGSAPVAGATLQAAISQLVAGSPSWTPPPTASPAATSTPLATATTEATPWPTATVPPTPTADPFAAVGAPARLQIPSIGVDAFIEHVGVTHDGAMDVPKGWMNVGWYRQGFFPGEHGNAVMAGHLDSNTGGPAVFWDLDKLQSGDEIVVTYENNDQYTFVVTGQQVYEYNAEGPIIESIFGRALTPNLNLITCDGAWSRGQATYSHRLVVFTTLVPEKTVRGSAAVEVVQ